MKTIVALVCFAPALLAQELAPVKTVTGDAAPTRHVEPDLIANSANVLADAVIKASGGDRWASVKSIDFTFNAGQNDKPPSSVKHHWDLAANTDTVERNGKSVTVDLAAQNTQGDAKGGYQRWVNDSYWLLAPLKLRDRGTHLADKGEQQVDGKTLRVLELSFDQVGLTSHDKYNFYIDPAMNLVVRWDYMPSPEKKVSGTWEKYQDFNGLKLATEHQFGGKRIYFTDVKVTTD